jgi:hypothetical protein
VGRTSLVIGLVAVASAIALGDFLAALMKGSRIGEIVRESLTIGGWVSMWRPLEIFLYDWWPIRSEARLSDRLAAMPVRIRYINATAPDAWRADWPAVSPRGEFLIRSAAIGRDQRRRISVSNNAFPATNLQTKVGKKVGFEARLSNKIEGANGTSNPLNFHKNVSTPRSIGRLMDADFLEGYILFRCINK